MSGFTASVSFDPADFNQGTTDRFSFQTECIGGCSGHLVWKWDDGEPMTRDYPGYPGHYYVESGCAVPPHGEIAEQGKPYDEIETVLMRVEHLASVIDDVAWAMKRDGMMPYRRLTAPHGWAYAETSTNDDLESLPF